MGKWCIGKIRFVSLVRRRSQRSCAGRGRPRQHITVTGPALQVLALVGLGFVVGCTGMIGPVPLIGDDPGEGGEFDCEGVLGPPRDPADFEECCTDWVESSAHCLPEDTVPEIARDFVGNCEGGGFCVPDPFIETGGLVELRDCTAFDDSPGRCVSPCVPLVGEFAGILRADVCDPGDLCVPCTYPDINGLPQAGEPTLVCEIEFTCDLKIPDELGGEDDPVECPYDGEPLIDVDELDECGSCGDSHCMDAELLGSIDTELTDRLASCNGGDGLCVPDEFLESFGQSVPQSCESLEGMEGRCLSTCLPEVQGLDTYLPVDVCDSGEKCVPCFDPLNGGEPTGACEIACDVGPDPAEEPVVFDECCSGNGTCVPADLAGESALFLGQDVCPPGEDFVCAPNEYIEGPIEPAHCQSSSFFAVGSGRCLPSCIPIVGTVSIALLQDSCASTQVCVPCEVNIPFVGVIPTGACVLFP